MPIHDDLGNRMKIFYEQVPKTKLIRRMPVIIRIDGKAFHTFTIGFHKPFDEILIETMQETTKYLCENIQGCVLGYTQSDEISLILVDYQNLNTSAWFDYEVQKMCSIAASMATMIFNKIFVDKVWEYIAMQNFSLTPQSTEFQKEQEKYNDALKKAKNKGAMFDARVFNIPKEEVTNYIYWRQLDAIRNSIQMVGQSQFSHKELQNKTCNDIQNMLMVQRNINWNNFQSYLKRGSCVIKTPTKTKIVEDNIGENGEKKYSTVMVRSVWFIDKDIPIFKGEDRNYIEKLIMIGE